MYTTPTLVEFAQFIRVDFLQMLHHPAEAERQLADKEAELTKLLGELGERSLIADSQRTEITAFRTQSKR